VNREDQNRDEEWEPENWPSTDWLGDALDLAIEAGGVFSMRRHGSRLAVAVVPGQSVLSLTRDEALTVATSLLAAVRLVDQSGEQQ
jgi:hypothetical protein